MKQPLVIEEVCRPRTVVEIPIENIVPNPRQPRRDFDSERLASLRDSISRYGILQPISVRRAEAGFYEIIAGERRFRAACDAGFRLVPAIVIDTDEQESAELAIIENLQRQDLNIFEQASAISSLLNIYHMTQDEAADKLSVSQSYVANKLRLLRFTDEERTLILENSLTERHARALLRVRDEKERISALKHIISFSLNVAATEKYIDSISSKHVTKPKLRLSMKNFRLFYNSVEHAADIMRSSGIPVKIERDETSADAVVITITVGGASANVSRETSSREAVSAV